MAEGAEGGDGPPPKRQKVPGAGAAADGAAEAAEPAVGALYAAPLRYVVISQTGLTLRQDCTLQSPPAGRVDCGSEVEVVERRPEPGRGLMRVRVQRPVGGWATELPRFLALAPGQEAPEGCAAAGCEELARREADALNERGEDLRAFWESGCPDCAALEEGLDLDRLRRELAEAEREHGFLEKTAVLHATQEHAGTRGWGSIPLRSVGGKVGDEGNTGTGVLDAAAYEDTPIMRRCCPYIREVVGKIRARRVLRVRLMRLQAGGAISPHRDHFESQRVVRLHLPIVTSEGVEFRIRGRAYRLAAGTLYFANVRQEHEGANRSREDRVHLVVDVEASLALQDQIRSGGQPPA